MHRKTELCTERLSYAPKDRFLEHNSCLKNITRRLEHNSIIACSDCISNVMSSIINMSGGGKSRKTRANLEKTDADNTLY